MSMTKESAITAGLPANSAPTICCATLVARRGDAPLRPNGPLLATTTLSPKEAALRRVRAEVQVAAVCAEVEPIMLVELGDAHLAGHREGQPVAQVLPRLAAVRGAVNARAATVEVRVARLERRGVHDDVRVPWVD